jgi:hypothetical protein
VWLWAYPLYLALVTPIPSGIARYLLLCPSLALLCTLGWGTASRRRRLTGVALGCLLGLTLQVVWIELAFVVTTTSIMP